MVNVENVQNIFFVVKQILMKIYEQVESAYNFTIYLPNTRFNIIFICASISTNSLRICLRLRHIQLLYISFRVMRTGDSSPSPKQKIICLCCEAISSIQHDGSLLRIVFILSFTFSTLLQVTPLYAECCLSSHSAMSTVVVKVRNKYVLYSLTLRRRNFFFNFSTLCI